MHEYTAVSKNNYASLLQRDTDRTLPKQWIMLCNERD